jgi:Protein of unknown function (DUF3034)
MAPGPSLAFYKACIFFPSRYVFLSMRTTAHSWEEYFMQKNALCRALLLGGLLMGAAACPLVAVADDGTGSTTTTNGTDNLSGKLLLTGGVTQVEGAAGGGLTPWAVIGGYGTEDQIGANAFYTHVNLQNYSLNDAGALVGLFNRVEFSIAQQRFNTEDVGAELGLGRGFTFDQNIIGLKVRLFGDAVLDQDSWIPEVSVGAQYKTNNQGAVLHAIGASSDEGTDYYLAATKLFLSQSVLVDATVRFTKSNQMGILGFGGPLSDSYKAEFEGSVAYLLTRNLAIGAEYRQMPNNLTIAKQDNWYDGFIAWAPIKNVSLTVAYANLGNIVIKNNQHGVYASVQVGF